MMKNEHFYGNVTQSNREAKGTIQEILTLARTKVLGSKLLKDPSVEAISIEK